MRDEIIQDSSLSSLRKGIATDGKIRSALLLGKNRENLEKVLAELNQSTFRSDASAFWVSLDSQKIKNPYEWCSQFARNLRTLEGVKLADLANFALNTGKSLSPFKQPHDGKESGEIDSGPQIAKELVKHFEELVKSSSVPSPHIVILINGLAGFSNELLSWMVGEFNSTIRKSDAFKKVRFLFATDSLSERVKIFFDQFGFEKVHLVELEPKPESQNKSEFKTTSMGSERDFISDSLKNEDTSTTEMPKKNPLPFGDISAKNKLGSMVIDDAKNLLSSFNEGELEHLFLASYPTRISKYTLEHFGSPRDAALSYNWLKRQQSLYSKHGSDDLILNEDIRNAARTLHASTSPDVSEKWSTLGSVLDAFMTSFPNDSSHWIPLNLQLLESFNKKMIRALFSGDRLEALLDYINFKDNQLVEKNSRLSLSEDAKLVTRRYMELTEKKPIPGLEDEIRKLWLHDQDTFTKRKADISGEKEEITSEIEKTLNQVSQIKETRDSLLDNFRNPKKNKAEKVYSFTTSRLLVVIGFATIGASLLSESIGSYHAACGLALTIVGFFWPNVDIKRPAFASGGPQSNLAIETQQRSLNHRMSSLSNRIQVMKTNLNSVEKQLLELGDSPPLPYLDSEQSEG